VLSDSCTPMIPMNAVDLLLIVLLFLYLNVSLRVNSMEIIHGNLPDPWNRPFLGPSVHSCVVLWHTSRY
jgi:hypothetical protein